MHIYALMQNLTFAEMLTELREIFEEETQASMELDNLEIEMNSEETALKKREYEETKEKLAQLNKQISGFYLYRNQND